MVPRVPVDLLILADIALTMEPGARPLNDVAIAVRGDRIVEIGSATELVARHPDVRTFGGRGRLAIPGLINAHQHLTGDRLIRSMIPDDLPAGDAIFSWAVPAHAAHTGDDDELSATLSLVEAVCNGITFTVEAGTVAHPERVLAGFDAVGVGGTLGSWGWDVAGEPWAGSVDEVLDRQRQVLALTQGHPSVAGWVTLVGHDLASDELLVGAADLARELGTGMTMHLSPTSSDPERYLERTGRRPIEHLGDLGVLGRHLLIGHGVWLDDAEVDLVLSSDTALAYCPWAYLRLGQGVFLQVLEGESRKVTNLYARIHADPRHKELELIHCEGIAKRRYGDWSMAHVRLSDVDPQAKIVWPDFDPYSPRGQLVMARIDELIAQGRVIEAPPP